MGSLSLEQLEALTLSPLEQKQRLNNLSPEGRRQLRGFLKETGMLEEIEAEISSSKKWNEREGAYIEKKRKPELTFADWFFRVAAVMFAARLLYEWAGDPWLTEGVSGLLRATLGLT